MNSTDPVLALIGNTPVVRLQNIDTGPCELYVKLESQNPGGSIKDRIALTMIEAAERSGQLRAGGTIIEATAGNTGLGLALVAVRKGYRIKLIVPDKMSTEKIQQLKAMGAEVILTRSDVNKGHPLYYQDLALRIASETPGAYYIDQFNNPANPLAHTLSTGPEIWQQMDQQLDAIAVGVGSSGTLSGLSAYFADTAPQMEFVLADPQGSILADYVETGHFGQAGSWRVEGIGEDFIPPLANFAMVKKAYRISDQESLFTARALLEKEGILAGSSSGTLVAAALRYCRAQTTPKRVLTFICDSGNKYLSKQFNDNWLVDQGLLREPQRDNLSDLITRPHHKGATVFARQEDSLADAYQKMRRHDVSQLPVIEGEAALAGLIDEWDILNAVRDNKENFKLPVRSVMSTDLVTLAPQDTLERVIGIFADNKVAPVIEQGNFLGLITQTDLINYWQQH
ncbi:pyridoxal-phosphate dependent enzyme [Undibacterium rugosum]|uniref:Cysteine synthase B n=1 Tax=Undibacterium rugosum TaxID=2762291 RepID=A0A923HYR6_9BURK|nr:cystathionine beta-synthase [Undibacterium rugosum]MBC3933782.1 cystathionine beta-synthase [Undibacterium rugosum]MBR7777485.1 cystathionine beta-synthase [Undibacterium rugosum]